MQYLPFFFTVNRHRKKVRTNKHQYWNTGTQHQQQGFMRGEPANGSLQRQTGHLPCPYDGHHNNGHAKKYETSGIAAEPVQERKSS